MHLFWGINVSSSLTGEWAGLRNVENSGGLQPRLLLGPC